MRLEYDKNIPDPQNGDLLISEPFLHDPNFDRTVILVCENGEEGTFGLVVNKMTDLLLDEVMNESFDLNGFNGRLNLGGPVEQNTLHYIHRIQTPVEGAIEIGEGLYWSGNYEQIKTMITNGQVAENEIKFFLGYSGWSEGQLRKELDSQSWFVKPKATARQIFDLNEDELWKSILKEMGGKYKVFSNYPADPRLN
ncbi:YqgE/AlgH family protein [Roseivirga sp.]|uniref:YqgE/AlgH family protein n=1 Tax=Roseivirga sp. TaxID=1964215 RepID=UPI002B271F74|nr:YqgE/AlgH family protein [Roseivirga sp.]